jgi:hypothetical protein
MKKPFKTHKVYYWSLLFLVLLPISGKGQGAPTFINERHGFYGGAETGLSIMPLEGGGISP